MIRILSKNLVISFLSSLLLTNIVVANTIDAKVDSLVNLLENVPDTNKIEVLNKLVEVYDTISYAKSLGYALESLELTRKLKNDEAIASVLFTIGKIEYYLGDFDKAIDYFLKALAIREKFNNQKEIAESYNMLGIVYMEINDKDKALDYLNKAWDLSNAIGNFTFAKKISNNLGIIYTKRKEYEKALSYYQITLDHCVKNKDKKTECVTLNNIGATYWYLKKYHKALEYYFKALNISKAAGNKWSISNTSRNIGEVYINLGNYSKSEQYLKNGLVIAKEINSKQLIRDCYLTLSELYYAKTDYKNAYNYHKKYSDIKDSIFSDDMGKNIAQMDVKFEIIQKEKENEILKKENEITLLKLKKQENQRNFLIIGTLLILLSIGVLFNRYQTKKKDNRLLETAIRKISKSEKDLKESNSTKDKLFSIIAHDLRSPFNVLVGLTDLLSQKVDSLSATKIKEYSTYINQSSIKVLSLIDSLLTWSRSQTGKIKISPEYINLKEIVDSCIEIVSLHAKEKGISIISNLSENDVSYADKGTIVTVIRNILSNAVKFTPNKGVITVKSNKEDNFISILISDTGVGISKENLSNLFKIESGTTKGTNQEEGTGLGLIICKEFVEKNKGSISVESEVNVGTTFKISLPNSANS